MELKKVKRNGFPQSFDVLHISSQGIIQSTVLLAQDLTYVIRTRFLIYIIVLIFSTRNYCQGNLFIMFQRQQDYHRVQPSITERIRCSVCHTILLHLKARQSQICLLHLHEEGLFGLPLYHLDSRQQCSNGVHRSHATAGVVSFHLLRYCPISILRSCLVSWV